jgi:hypothetical protein
MVSIFTSQTPASGDLTDATAYTLGTTFYSTADGDITGIRWFFPATLPGGTVTAKLYDYAAETELGSATFSDPVAGDWNVATFAAPVAISADVPYVAAVHTPDRYVFSSGTFASADVTNSPLVAPQDNTDPLGTGSLRNARLNVGASPAYPGATSAGNCFFADVVYSAGGQSAAVGTVVETDTAIAVGRHKHRAVGTAAQTDTAVAIARSKIRTVGTATSSETALPIGRMKTRTLGVAAETGTAISVGRTKRQTLGLATETDTALPITLPGVADVKASSTAAVTAGRTSSTAVTAGRTSTPTVAPRATSSTTVG